MCWGGKRWVRLQRLDERGFKSTGGGGWTMGVLRGGGNGGLMAGEWGEGGGD